MSNNYKQKNKNDHLKKKRRSYQAILLLGLIALLAATYLNLPSKTQTPAKKQQETIQRKILEKNIRSLQTATTTKNTRPFSQHYPQQESDQRKLIEKNDNTTSSISIWKLENAQSLDTHFKEYPALINEWRGNLTPTPQDLLSSIRKKQFLPYEFELQLPNGLSLNIHIHSLKLSSPQQSTLKGNIQGYPYARFLLSLVNESAVGTIRIPEENRVYEIRPSSHGKEYLISEINAEILSNARQ